MKKALPSIIVLILLSLAGLIILEISWLNNLLAVTQEQMLHKVSDVAYTTAVDLSKSVSYGPSLTLPRRPDYRFGFGNDILRFAKPLSVSDRYSEQQMYATLANAFQHKGLHNLSFDFAVISRSDEIEMQSANFETEFKESLDSSSSTHSITINISAEPGIEMSGTGPFEQLSIVVPGVKKQALDSVKWVIVGCALFTLIIIAAFYITVKALIDQRKLGEIKSDFINNMTHELKTPLATISLAIDAIRNEKVQNNREQLKYFSGIIKEENKRMNKHVETILQAALMEKQELQLNRKKLHANEVIAQVMENYELQLQEKQGRAELLLNAKQDTISADEVHFTNLISNLVDNAIKYSKKDLLIRITTHCTHKSLIIAVQDNGIGMSKESVKRVFEKFYRAPTGNVHNVKGFGLGMSYVKTVVDAHKGKIRVESVLGKGSTFTIEFPFDE